jgi:hypothetical protein
LLARAYPASRFTGFDFAEEAFAIGRGEAQAWGWSNARFEVSDVATLDRPDAFEVITAFDAVHDQAHPRTLDRGQPPPGQTQRRPAPRDRILRIDDRFLPGRALNLMAWSSTSMAARYQHVTDPIRREVTGRVNGLLSDRRRDDRGSTETKIETTTEFSA